MSEYLFRLVNPRSDDDMDKYISLIKKLSDFCCDNQTFNAEKIKWARFHMGALEYADEKFKTQPLLPLEENADEFAFVCELEDRFLGYVDICDYRVENGKRIEDEIGTLHDIYVDNDFRNGTIAYSLLMLAIDKLLERGKTKAICNVQEDNPNRFIHFAMAEGNVVSSSDCKRRDGKITTDYVLLIDLLKLKNWSLRDFAKRVLKTKKEMTKELENRNI